MISSNLNVSGIESSTFATSDGEMVSFSQDKLMVRISGRANSGSRYNSAFVLSTEQFSSAQISYS